MKTTTNRFVIKIIPSLATLWLFCFLFCQESRIVDVTDENTLEQVIDSEFKRLQMPGLAYAAVKDDSIVYIGAKGYASKKTEQKFTPQTRMMIASISKTMAVTALMQLYEKKSLSLDDDISDHLPFTVRNPRFPDEPITVEMLLTHTTSISDAGQQITVLLFGYVDFPESLMSAVRNYVTKDGRDYTEDNFSSHHPGEQYEYTNIGSGLIACLVGHISGTDYNSYCKEYIFTPLGMTKTTWFLSETPREEVAIPYTDNNNTDPLNPYMTNPFWPSDQLMTTVKDLSRFLRAYLLGGTFNGYQLLKSETVDLILSNYLINSRDEQQGLIFHTEKAGDRLLWGHGGDTYGISTAMYFDKEYCAGFIVFINRMYGHSEILNSALLLHALQ
jgi:CubicO group peptidase (beta-lactamase class C family)